MLDHMRDALLQWFEGNRRNFFWRTCSDPYIILITEILLKKTTAAVVNHFLPSFLERYPNVRALHEGSTSGLQALLAPLGLSKQRTTQLKSLAKVLVESYGDEVPCHKEELLKLPGVGDYTASAVLSFAYRMPEAIVDTNIARLVIRLFGIEPSRYEARRSPEIWEKAMKIVGRDGSKGKFVNWALLDLAATVCKLKKPLHEQCPVKAWCIFYEKNGK